MSSVRVVMRDLPLALAETSAAETHLRALAAKRLRCSPHDIDNLTIVRRALDARSQSGPLFRYNICLDIPSQLSERAINDGSAFALEAPLHRTWTFPRPPDGPPPIIIGAGPAGLFAALTLAEAGWPPVVIERGKPVEERSKDVSRLYGQGILNENSNVCFGEGGAGTYSDGKLYTRVNDPEVGFLLRKLVSWGAKRDILIDARPHVGTDKLVNILRAVRQHLTSLGATFHFERVATGIRASQGAVIGVDAGDQFACKHLIVASGHSARRVPHMLQESGAQIEARPFSVGFRVEHPQPLINAIRYGRWSETSELPAADYRYAHQTRGGRGVYSFCMCPGGVVVATPTAQEELCINGMSHASRSGRFANSAIVVTITPEDTVPWSKTETPFAGVAFQRAVESKAYHMGGGSFVAPSARLPDFVAQRTSSSVSPTSYRRGIVPAPLEDLYPTEITAALREGLQAIDRQSPGFITSEAQVLGVETRTASPIRVLRGSTGEAVGLRGVYPAGEGMGYGGGIVSAALDGIRVASHLLRQVGAIEKWEPSSM